MVRLSSDGTLITVHDERSSQVQVPLGDTVDWAMLRSHLCDDLHVQEWKKILDAVISFEEGTLNGRNILVTWSTGSYHLDTTREARTVNIFLKGDV